MQMVQAVAVREPEESKMADRNCDGCFHYYGMFRCNKGCNYIFDRGHRRPCPPGIECTVKITEEEAVNRGYVRKAREML